MQLTDDQKSRVKAWVAEGLGLSEVQRNISKEFGVSMTYMDVRFLVLELGVSVREKKRTAAVQLEGKARAAERAPAGDDGFEELEEEAPGGAGAGQVTVEVDRINKPGALVSGSVKFSDGTRAQWALDQFGRLSLDAGKAGYQPSPADIQSFQTELRKALERRGFR